MARKCKEQELDACACDFSVDSSTNNEDATTIIGGCGDNCEFGVKIAKQFTDAKGNHKNCCSLATLHNNKVGRTVSSYSYMQYYCILSYNTFNYQLQLAACPLADYILAAVTNMILYTSHVARRPSDLTVHHTYS